MTNKLLSKFLKKYRGQLFLFTLFAIVAAVIGAIAGYTLNFLLTGIDTAENPINHLWSALITIIFWQILSIVLTYLVVITRKWLSIKLQNEWRLELSQVIIGQSYKDYISRDSGNYLTWLTNDAKRIGLETFTNLIYFIEDSFFALAHFVAICFLSPWLGLSSFVLAIAMYLIPKSTTSKVQEVSKIFTKAETNFITRIKDLTQGFRELYVLNEEEYFINEAGNENLEYENTNLNTQKTILRSQLVVNLVALIGMMGGVVLAGLLVFYGLSPLGSVVSMIWMNESFVNGFNNAIQMLVEFRASFSIWEKYEDIFVEAGNKTKAIEHSGNSDFVIETRDLQFTYPESDRIFAYPDLSIRSDKKYIIKGDNGTGKSTLLRLLLGLYPVSSGSINLAGNNINEVSKHEIFSYIAYMLQETHIFTGTIRENLCLDKGHSDEEIYSALEKVNLANFVSRQKGGLDYEIEENGKNLSGGQKQRLALARHILRGIEFFVLDEATSNVDQNTRDLVENTIFKNPNIGLIVVDHSYMDTEGFDYVIDLDKQEKAEVL